MAQPIAVGKPVRGVLEIDEGLSGFSTKEMYREILSRLGEDPIATDCWPRRRGSRSLWPF